MEIRFEWLHIYESVHSSRCPFYKTQVIDMKTEKRVQFCLFFLKIWPKTYPHFYEKQRYNLEWPNHLHVFRLQARILRIWLAYNLPVTFFALQASRIAFVSSFVN